MEAQLQLSAPIHRLEHRAILALAGDVDPSGEQLGCPRHAAGERISTPPQVFMAGAKRRSVNS